MAKLLDKIVVVDVEATCWKERPPANEESEIIEIGACLFDLKTFERDRKTSILVRPQRSKVSPFCTELTSLTQEEVDKGIPFRKACSKLAVEFSTQARTWASYGDYDRSMFDRQCGRFGVKYPFGKTHINIKNLFALMKSLDREVGMDEALSIIGAKLEGTHHRGDDDAWNIALLLQHVFSKADETVALMDLQKRPDPLGSKGMAWIGYFKGTPSQTRLYEAQKDIYNGPPSGESGFVPKRIKDKIADYAGLQAWFLGQVIEVVHVHDVRYD